MDNKKQEGTISYFINPNDAYKYLDIDVASLNNGIGVKFVENFHGNNSIFISENVPKDSVIITGNCKLLCELMEKELKNG